MFAKEKLFLTLEKAFLIFSTKYSFVKPIYNFGSEFNETITPIFYVRKLNYGKLRRNL